MSISASGRSGVTPSVIAPGLAIIGLCIAAASTDAAQMQIRDAEGGESANGNPGGYYLSGTGSRPRIALGDAPFHSGYSGIFDFEIDAFDGNGWTSLYALCIQPEVDLPFGTRPGDEFGALYDVAPLHQHPRFGAVQAHRTSLLWAHAFESAKADRTSAAAFQLLIWEFATDSDADLLSGAFRIDITHAFTAEVYTIASAWLTNILDGSWTETAHLTALTSASGQDLVMQIPLPGTPAAALLMVLTAGARRRRDT